MIVGVLLAAGASSRMGRPKMLLPAGSETVLAACARPLLDGGLERVVVVLGSLAEEIRRDARLPEDPRLDMAVNDDWGSGMASSLRRGLEACQPADAVLIALGDQLGVTPELVRRIAEAGRLGRALVVPVVANRASHPVLLGASLFPEIESLRGDLGARDIVRRHWSDAEFVEGVALRDLDTDDDYRDFVQGREPRSPDGFPAPDSSPRRR